MSPGELSAGDSQAGKAQMDPLPVPCRLLISLAFKSPDWFLQGVLTRMTHLHVNYFDLSKPGKTLSWKKAVKM